MQESHWRSAREGETRRGQEGAGEPSDLEADLMPLKAEREGRLGQEVYTAVLSRKCQPAQWSPGAKALC